MHWDIDSIVAELRAVRVRSLEKRQRTADRPPRLPSRKALLGILDGLNATLFPNRLGAPDLTDEGIDYFVGHTLDATLRHLLEQVRRELRYSSEQQGVREADRERATEITRAIIEPSWKPNLTKNLIAASGQSYPSHYVVGLKGGLMPRLLRPVENLPEFNSGGRESARGGTQ